MQNTAYEMRISDWSSDVCSSDLHQPVEVVFDQTDLPCVIGRFQVLQIVVAVDVNQAELAVLGGITRTREPRVEHEIVLLRLPGKLAPDDQRAAPIRRVAGHGAEPPGAGRILAQPPREAEPRSEERRVGQEWVSTCRFRWSPAH